MIEGLVTYDKVGQLNFSSRDRLSRLVTVVDFIVPTTITIPGFNLADGTWGVMYWHSGDFKFNVSISGETITLSKAYGPTSTGKLFVFRY